MLIAQCSSLGAVKVSRVRLDGGRGSLRWFFRDSSAKGELFQAAGLVDSELHKTFQFRLANFSMPSPPAPPLLL